MGSEGVVAVINALFAGIGNLGNLAVAVTGLLVVWNQYLVLSRVKALASDVKQIEIQNNSMRSSLEAAAHAKGMVAGAEKQSDLDTAQAIAVNEARAEGTTRG